MQPRTLRRIKRVASLWAATSWCAVALSLSGCKGCNSSDDEANSSTSQQPALPVAAPERTLATFVLIEPQKLWTESRAAMGADLFPSHLQLAVAGFLDLPPITATRLDETAPIFGVVLPGRTEQPNVVFALKAQSGRELLAALTTGNSPPFRVERVEHAVSLLARTSPPAAPTASESLHFGILGNAVIAGTDPGAVVEAAPYLAAQPRALTTQGEPRVELDFRKAALEGPVVRLLRERWKGIRGTLVSSDQEQRKARGRAPDFGDPAAIIVALSSMVDTALEFIETARSLKAVFRFDGGTPDFELVLEPAAHGPAHEFFSGLPEGSRSALLDLPQQTQMALLFHRASSPTAAGATSDFARSVAAQLSAVLGPRLSADQSHRVEQALTELGQAVGSPVRYGMLSVEGGPCGFVEMELRSPRDFRQAVAKVTDVLRLPAFAEPLASASGHRLGPARQHELVGLDKPADEVVLQGVGPSGGKPEPRLLWIADGDTGYVVIGRHAEKALAILRKPELTIGASASTSSASGATSGAEPKSAPSASKEVALALYANLGRSLDSPSSDAKTTPGPVWITLGRRGDAGVLRVQLGAESAKAPSALFETLWPSH